MPLVPREGEETLRIEDILETLTKHGDEVSSGAWRLGEELTPRSLLFGSHWFSITLVSFSTYRQYRRRHTKSVPCSVSTSHMGQETSMSSWTNGKWTLLSGAPTSWSFE